MCVHHSWRSLGLTPMLLQELRARDPYLEYRQLGVVRADGRCHAHTGSSCRANAHHLLRQQKGQLPK